MDLDLSAIPLVDQHCRGVIADPLDRTGFVRLLTQSRHPLPHGASWMDTQLGFAVRAWCPPVLDLAPHASVEEYLERRTELGSEDVTRRLLKATGITHYLVEREPDQSLLDGSQIAAVSGGQGHDIVELETVAEEVLRRGIHAADFVNAFAEALDAAASSAVALKSVLAYRLGFDLDPVRPASFEVQAAAGAYMEAAERDRRLRVDDPILLMHMLWAGIESRLPLQLHTGFGGPDLTLHRSDPALLTAFLRATARSGVPVVLLNPYPYHRNAGYLAHVFPHVYVDTGFTLSYVGTRAGAVLAETLELAPFSKVLFSTGAYGLPELFVVGAGLFREHLQRVLTTWVAKDACTTTDAVRVAQMITSENAEEVYRLS